MYENLVIFLHYEVDKCYDVSHELTASFFRATEMFWMTLKRYGRTNEVNELLRSL